MYKARRECERLGPSSIRTKYENNITSQLWIEHFLNNLTKLWNKSRIFGTQQNRTAAASGFGMAVGFCRACGWLISNSQHPTISNPLPSALHVIGCLLEWHEICHFRIDRAVGFQTCGFHHVHVQYIDSWTMWAKRGSQSQGNYCAFTLCGGESEISAFGQFCASLRAAINLSVCTTKWNGTHCHLKDTRTTRMTS